MAFIANFFLIVVVLSVAELYLLVHVSAGIGFLATLALCVLTGILGSALVRYQGLRTIGRMTEELSAGRLPATEILEGVVLIVCGALLCVPGFITDVLGFLMLVPPLRRVAVRWIQKKAAARIGFSSVGFGRGDPATRPRDAAIDVEYEVVDVKTEGGPVPRGKSGSDSPSARD